MGCSTGEFLINYNWSGEKCMEVNNNAILESNNGIMFEKNILNQRNYFDNCIQGTIQHLPSPFEYIEKAFIIEKSGHIVFLQHQMQCIYYKMFNDLPALDRIGISTFPQIKL